MTDQDDVLRSCRVGYENLMGAMVEYADAGHPVEPTELGLILEDYGEVLKRLGQPVQVPAEFAKLCAKGLTGNLPKRRGPRVHFDGPGNNWMIINMARRDFLERRANGEKYDDILEDIADFHNVSFKTAESWMRGLTLPKAPK